MVDLHTHILPQIDDGSKSVDISKAQLNCLYEQGVDCVVFTSHYYGKSISPDEFIKLREEAYNKIKNIIPKKMTVSLGAEVHFTKDLVVNNEDLCVMAIGNTHYILLEPPFLSSWDKGLFNRLYDFISDTNYVPIIAHVERYDEIKKSPELLITLKEMGCLIQVNATAFLENKTKGFALSLLKHNLIDCYSSDTHNMDKRTPLYYSEGAEIIKSCGYEKEFDHIQENMYNIINNKKVDSLKYSKVNKILGKYY